LATNTSSLPIIEIARATRRPDRVVGTHFFNPPPVMRLLEVVRSIATSDETLSDVRVFGERLGKWIIVAQDRGGFIVNLLLIPYLTHAVRLYESGFATREDIDDGMRLGCGHPMGPLQLLDLIGLDTAMFVCEALYEEYANGDYAPPPCCVGWWLPAISAARPVAAFTSTDRSVGPRRRNRLGRLALDPVQGDAGKAHLLVPELRRVHTRFSEHGLQVRDCRDAHLLAGLELRA